MQPVTAILGTGLFSLPVLGVMNLNHQVNESTQSPLWFEYGIYATLISVMSVAVIALWHNLQKKDAKIESLTLAAITGITQSNNTLQSVVELQKELLSEMRKNKP